MKRRFFWAGVLGACCALQYLQGQDNDFLPRRSTGTLCPHTGFTVSYVEKHHISEWVAYRLIDSMIIGGAERSNRFVSDPDLPNGSADPKMYAKSGYDKGHMCPAADMKYSSEAMQETFYTSNIAPQLPRLNRIVWKHLEQRVRSWAKQYGALIIVTGPVLRDSLPFIGTTEHISIPEYFYKVVLDNAPSHRKAIGFIMPNRECVPDLSTYAVSVDSVEALTHLDFFATLPDSVQSALEAHCNSEAWGIAKKENHTKEKKKY
jgi:endonuclease G